MLRNAHSDACPPTPRDPMLRCMDDPNDPAVLARVRAREALDAGDAMSALRWVDELPAGEQGDWLAEVWLLAGSVRGLTALLSTGAVSDARIHARAATFVATPPLRDLPAALADDAVTSYERLVGEADRLAALGRAAELAITHLALSRASPRSDWRAVHVAHAAALAFGLDDPRLTALVRAFEAERDLDFGELEDALEAARAAVAAGVASDEPRAIALGNSVIAAATARAHALAGAAAARIDSERESESEDL